MTDSLISPSAPETSTAEAPVTPVVETPVTEAPVTEAPVEEVTSEEIKTDQPLFAGKYKTLEDFETGHKELVQKLTEKRPEAPEEYKFDFSGHETLSKQDINIGEDPLFKEMLPMFKELNMSQDSVNKVVTKFLEQEMLNVPDMGDELAKLGPRGSETVKRVESFVGKNLDENEQVMARELATTAAGVKLLDKFAAMVSERPIPTEANFSPEKTQTELMSEAMRIRDTTPNFEVDTKAQAIYEQLMDKAVKLQLGVQ